MLGRLIRFITWPFRLVGRLSRTVARETKSSSRTAANASGSIVAGALGDDLLDEEYREEPPTGIETVLFKQLPRPRLTERAAAELSLEQATSYASQAKEFYRNGFPLFARGDFFYEEVEEDYLNKALGFDGDSIDKRFLDVTTLFRRTLNDNTRAMLLYWTQALFVITFGAAILLGSAGIQESLAGLGSVPGGAPAILFGAAAIIGFVLAFLVYSWPYKVVQQRNLMNLDNYITSKFARINNNFQVAKRRALNVERDKRMGQRDELKEEAGSWTLSYHWFAMRLLLCELVLRNKFYQVRRNTTLYWGGGLALTGVAFAVLFGGLILNGASIELLGAFAVASLVFAALSGAVLRRATMMMFRVIESNEWSRFHTVDLDSTIRDHVGEDKLQIVTFRDRNRME